MICGESVLVTSLKEHIITCRHSIEELDPSVSRLNTVEEQTLDLSCGFHYGIEEEQTPDLSTGFHYGIEEEQTPELHVFTPVTTSDPIILDTPTVCDKLLHFYLMFLNRVAL
jgi:hypothetical protein